MAMEPVPDRGLPDRDRIDAGRGRRTAIRQIRAACDLPDVPVVVLSATKGLPKGIRDRWTQLQSGLTESTAFGEHIIAQDTGHAIHQERPEQVADAVIKVLEHI